MRNLAASKEKWGLKPSTSHLNYVIACVWVAYFEMIKREIARVHYNIGYENILPKIHLWERWSQKEGS